VIQVRWASGSRRSAWIMGKATLTTVASSTNMNCPKSTANSAYQRRRESLVVIVSIDMIVTVGVIILPGKTTPARLYCRSHPWPPAHSRHPISDQALPPRLCARAARVAGHFGEAAPHAGVLRDRGVLPQQTLCDLLHTTQNTVVAWLNELEEAGFIERTRDPEDRRKHNVVLTRAGQVAIERAERELVRLEDEVLTRSPRRTRPAPQADGESAGHTGPRRPVTFWCFLALRRRCGSRDRLQEAARVARRAT